MSNGEVRVINMADLICKRSLQKCDVFRWVVIEISGHFNDAYFSIIFIELPRQFVPDNLKSEQTNFNYTISKLTLSIDGSRRWVERVSWTRDK